LEIPVDFFGEKRRRNETVVVITRYKFGPYVGFLTNSTITVKQLLSQFIGFQHHAVLSATHRSHDDITNCKPRQRYSLSLNHPQQYIYHPQRYKTTQHTMADHEVMDYDPLFHGHDEVVREGDWLLFHFPDGRQVFGQCLKNARGKSPPLKINKRNYPTYNLIGLPYGTVLEMQKNKLIPLPDDQNLLPDMNLGDFVVDQANDNRNIVDDNKSQTLQQEDLDQLKADGTAGSQIIQSLIENSATFDSKTEFSKAKWLTRKLQKWQPRCRIVKCSGRTICEAMYLKDARKILNLREDTLGQMLSYANISAGSQVLVYETTQGILMGSLAQRMGGYGKILGLYSGQQPSCMDMLEKFNLPFAESHSIKWLHTEEVFASTTDYPEEEDLEAQDRDLLKWPCPLQEHTRKHLATLEADEKALKGFLEKRCNRFARKLTRTSPLEVRAMLRAKPSDSILIATKNDPTESLMGLLPHLAPSCPFVVFCEYMEPLTHCFLELQKKNIAINLRLTDTWMREYQVLPGRTHPNMNMSQNGGFLLTGIKLDPVHGVSEMDESVRKEIRDQMGGRRGKKKRATPTPDDIDKADGRQDNKKKSKR
jgi:tRNA (adenine-N(1)-)-methyltransferase non-catalytic subunit